MPCVLLFALSLLLSACLEIQGRESEDLTSVANGDASERTRAGQPSLHTSEWFLALPEAEVSALAELCGVRFGFCPSQLRSQCRCLSKQEMAEYLSQVKGNDFILLWEALFELGFMLPGHRQQAMDNAIQVLCAQFQLPREQVHIAQYRGFDVLLPGTRKLERAEGDESIQLVMDSICWECTSAHIVVDIGVLYGEFSFSAAAHGCSVHSFEPQHVYASFVSATAKLNGLAASTFGGGEITVYHAAVSTLREGTAVILAEGGGQAYVSLQTGGKRKGKPVQTVMLDDLFRDREIFLMKVDVEGFEGDVIQSSAELLETRRVRHLIFEFSAVKYADRSDWLAILRYVFQEAGALQCFLLSRSNAGLWRIPATRLDDLYTDFTVGRNRDMQTDIYCQFQREAECWGRFPDWKPGTFVHRFSYYFEYCLPVKLEM